MYSASEGLQNAADCVDCLPGTYTAEKGATGMTSYGIELVLSSAIDITADAGAVVTQTIVTDQPDGTRETDVNTGTLRVALDGDANKIVIDFERIPVKTADIVIKFGGVFTGIDACSCMPAEDNAACDDISAPKNQAACDSQSVGTCAGGGGAECTSVANGPEVTCIKTNDDGGNACAWTSTNLCTHSGSCFTEVNFVSDNDVKSCLDCPIGTGTTTAGVASIEDCKACDEGLYQDEKGKTACKRCARGLYNQEKEKTASTDCVGCIEGRYSTSEGLANDDDCVKCPPVSYFLLQLPSLPFYY